METRDEMEGESVRLRSMSSGCRWWRRDFRPTALRAGREMGDGVRRGGGGEAALERTCIGADTADVTADAPLADALLKPLVSMSDPNPTPPKGPCDGAPNGGARRALDAALEACVSAGCFPRDR